MIIELGFGPGNFRHNFANVSPGDPFVILGREYSEFGLPYVNTQYFDYDNPGQNLTFHWFKHNIMCKEKPWICSGGSSREASTTSKKGSKKGKGSKKNRRKHQTSS